MQNTGMDDPVELTFQWLEEMTDNFSKERIVGQGAYGTVYKGKDRNGQDEVAVKLLHNVWPGHLDEAFENELLNLKKLNHPHITKLIGYCYETKYVYTPYKGKTVLAAETHRALCLEYLHNGSLQNFLSEGICDGPLDWHTRFRIIKGACEGLKYLHEEFDEPIYHLDLKPDNILLDLNMVPKLADFGLSKIFGGEQTQFTLNCRGTSGYMPPEYIQKGLISKMFDIYSMGVVMIKTVSGLKGRSMSAEMDPQEFINLVHDTWRRKLQEKWGGSSLEAYCKQVKRCTEIGLKCVEVDRQNRPNIVDIVHELSQLETAADKQRQASCAPSVKLTRFKMSAAHRVVPEGVAAKRKPAVPEVVDDVVKRRSGLPVFVLMPPDTIRRCGCALKRRKDVQDSLTALKIAGVEGIVVDVWWGIAEGEGPGEYHFPGYVELMEMARNTGLKVQAVMCFHRCSSIPLPWWVVEEMEKDSGLCFTDQSGHRTFEYLSLGCHAMPVVKGRTPIECYTDFMRAFRDHFADYLGKTILEIKVGMGPDGVPRHPSFLESSSIGAVACNDRYMLNLKGAAKTAAGEPGYHAPISTGSLDDLLLLQLNGDEVIWRFKYDHFFHSWYSQMLLDHDDRVLSGATSVYGDTPGVEISLRVVRGARSQVAGVIAELTVELTAELTVELTAELIAELTAEYWLPLGPPATQPERGGERTTCEKQTEEKQVQSEQETRILIGTIL